MIIVCILYHILIDLIKILTIFYKIQHRHNFKKHKTLILFFRNIIILTKKSENVYKFYVVLNFAKNRSIFNLIISARKSLIQGG